MAKILLLGANGQLGSDVQRCFHDSTHEVFPVFRKDMDVETPDKIIGFLEEYRDFDYLINCTSYHKTDECEDFSAKAFTVNAIAVAEMAKYCKKGGKTFIHISTDYVFSGLKGAAYTEEDVPSPLSVYGNSKLAGEHFIQAYHDQYFIFRVSSLFGEAGASGKGGNFVETMLRMAREGKALKVVADQIMSPTHTFDIAKAIKTFIDLNINEYGVYHCSGDGECSWYDFAREIFKQTGIEADLSPITTGDFVTKAKRPVRSDLDNSKLNRYFQMPSWRQGLKDYLALKEHLQQVKL